MDLYQQLLQTKYHTDRTNVVGSSVRRKSVMAKHILYKAEQIHENVDSVLLEAVHAFKARVQEHKFKVDTHMDEHYRHLSDQWHDPLEFVSQIFSGVKSATNQIEEGYQAAKKMVGGALYRGDEEESVNPSVKDEDQTRSRISTENLQPDSASPAPEQIRPVPEIPTNKQPLNDSLDDRNQTDLSSAASQFVTQLVGDYEAAKYESYWGTRYATKGRVRLGTNDEAQSTSDVAVEKPPLESLSPASKQIPPVSEIKTEQVPHGSSADRNEIDLSSAASQFVTQLVGDYEAAKYESYWGRKYAAKGCVSLGTDDEDQTTSEVSVEQPLPESFSQVEETNRPVPETPTNKQLLNDSPDDRIETDLSSAASQFVMQLVGDYEVAKYESYWGRKYTARNYVGLGRDDEDETTSDVSVNQPPPESISPASARFRPVSEITTKQLLHDSSDDRNETDLSSAANQFVKHLVGGYKAAGKEEIDQLEQVTSNTQASSELSKSEDITELGCMTAILRN